MSYLKCKMWWVWIILLSTLHNQHLKGVMNVEVEHTDKHSRYYLQKILFV